MRKGWSALLLLREKHLVSLISECPLRDYSLLNMSVAWEQGAECPPCHFSHKYNTTPRSHPALCPRHTTYPVLCLAALAHRAGAGDAAAGKAPSTQNSARQPDAGYSLSPIAHHPCLHI